jgi:RNA polymerase sigma factor (sigma-70 family)
VIKRIVRHEQIAEEVLQDVFLKFWDRFESYDSSKGRLFTWMLNIPRNQAINKIRSKGINQEQKTSGIDYSVNERPALLEQPIDGNGIKDCLKVLSDEHRLIVEYLYFKGYTQSRVSEELNISLVTVKSHLRLAMQQLRLTLRVK